MVDGNTWMLNLRAAVPMVVTPPESLKLVVTNAALSLEVADNPARTSLTFSYFPVGSKSEATIVVASLRKAQNEHAKISLTLEGGKEYTFEAVGPNDIDLVGHYLTEHEPTDLPSVGVRVTRESSTSSVATGKRPRGRPPKNPKPAPEGSDGDYEASAASRHRAKSATAAVIKTVSKDRHRIGV